MSSSNVPFSVLAPMQSNYTFGVYIGDDRVPSPSGTAPSGDAYLIVVVNRSTLKPVYNEYWTQPDTAPPIPSEYNTSDYMLVVLTWAVTGPHMPTGAFYDFLVDNGAGDALRAAVNANNQVGCGTFGVISYILVGQMGEGLPSAYLGIESFSATAGPAGIYQPMELVPADINGTTVYTPSRLAD